MRPASRYHLAQAWPSKQCRHSGPARTMRRGRHAMVLRRYQPALARRVFAFLTGSSQPA